MPVTRRTPSLRRSGRLTLDDQSNEQDTCAASDKVEAADTTPKKGTNPAHPLRFREPIYPKNSESSQKDLSSKSSTLENAQKLSQNISTIKKGNELSSQLLEEETSIARSTEELMDVDEPLLTINHSDVDFEDVFNLPDASYDEYRLEAETINTKNTTSKSKKEDEDFETGWKEDELIFEDAEDLGLTPVVTSSQETNDTTLVSFENKKAKILFENETSSTSEQTTSDETKKRKSIKDRLFNLNDAPGLNVLLNIKEGNVIAKLECILCNETFETKNAEGHIKSRDHLLGLMKIEKPALFTKYREDTSISNDELYQIVKNVEQSMPKKLLSTVTKFTYNAVKNSRLAKIQNVLNSDKSLEGPKIIKSQDTAKERKIQTSEVVKNKDKIQFGNFKRIIILASSFYAAQLQDFACPGLVEVHTFKGLTLQTAKEQIEKIRKLRPPSVLYLLFLGVHSFANEDNCKGCLSNKCVNHLKQLFIKPEFTNAANTESKSNTIVNLTKSFMVSVNNSLPNDSKLLIMPPIPIEIMTFSSFKHNQLHEVCKLHPSIFLMNSTHSVSIMKFYQYFCKAFCSSILLLDEDSDTPHPFTMYNQHLKDHTQIITNNTGDESCLCKSWKQTIVEICSKVLHPPFASKFTNSQNAKVCINEPKLIFETKTGGQINSKPFVLGSQTFDHVVFVGNPMIIHKVSSYDETISNFSLIETRFPTNIKTLTQMLKTLKEKFAKILFLILDDISLIGKKFTFFPCIQQHCENPICIHSSNKTNLLNIKEDLMHLVEVQKLIRLQDKEWTCLIMPLFPSFAINHREEMEKESVHKLVHTFCPHYVYFFEGSASNWFTLSNLFKVEWTEQVKTSLKDFHKKFEPFSRFVSMNFPLVRWQDMKQPCSKIQIEVDKAEAAWKEEFVLYLRNSRPKDDLSLYAVTKSGLSQFESKMANKNKLLQSSLSTLCLTGNQPFKRLILVGDSNLLAQFTCPFIAKKLTISLQDPESINSDDLSTQLKLCNDQSTACFLLFNSTCITNRQIDIQKVCYGSQCRQTTVVSNIPNSFSVMNKFNIIKNLMGKLSKEMPTFLVPLYPSITYSLYPRRLVGHKNAHLLSRQDLSFCTQTEIQWTEHFQHFAFLWSQLLEENHKDYATSLIVKKYIEEQRVIQLFTPRELDLLTPHWSERNIWKSFVDKFLVNIVNTSNLNQCSDNIDLHISVSDTKNFTNQEKKNIEATSKAATLVEPSPKASTPVKSLASSSTTVKPTTKLATPLNQLAKPATPINPLAKTTTPVNPLAKPATSVNPLAKSATSVNPLAKSATPVNPLAKPNTPANPLAKQTTAANPLAKQTTPANQLAKPSMPANQLSKPVTPVNQLPKPAMPVNPLVRPDAPVNPLSKQVTSVNPLVKATPPVNQFKKSATSANQLPKTDASANLHSSPQKNSVQAIPAKPLQVAPILPNSQKVEPTAAPLKSAPKVFKNVVIIENASDYVPLNLIKDLSCQIESSASLTTEEGYFKVEMKQRKNAQLLAKELDNLRIADCILKTSIIEYNPHQSFSIPQMHDRLFPKIYQKHFSVIVIRISKLIGAEHDPATFKLTKCNKDCRNIDSCLDYHNNIDRRRHPFYYQYSSHPCDSGVKLAMSCPYNGLQCPYAHNTYEQLLHPSVFQTLTCPSQNKEGKCNIKPICKFAHRDTPEMIFHKLWKDKLIFGLRNSIKYFVGSVRGRCKRPDLRTHINLFISPDPEVVRLVDASLNSLILSHRMIKTCLTGTANINCSNAQVVLGTLSDIISNKTLLTRNNHFSAIVVDDIAAVLNTPHSKDMLFKIINTLRSISTNFNAIQKIFVADINDDRSIASSVSRQLGIEIQVIDAPRIPSKAASLISSSPHNGMKETPNQAGSSQKKRSRSRSKSPSPSKAAKLEPSVVSIKNEFSEEEQRIMDEVTEEFEVFGDVPEMHPNYEKHYEDFIGQYRSQYPKIDNEKHLEHQWKIYWDGAFLELKQKEVKKRIEQLSKQSGSTKTEPENEDMFTVEAALDLLEDLKGKLSIMGSPVMKLVDESRSKGTDTADAISVFASADAQKLLSIVCDKFKKHIETASLVLKPVFKTASDWTKRLMEMAQKDVKPPKCSSIINSLPLDMAAIAKVTKGKTNPFILDFIKSTLALHGIDKSSPKDIEDIFSHLKKLQSNMT